MRYICIALIACLAVISISMIGCKSQPSKSTGEIAQQSVPPTPVDPAPEFSMKGDNGSGHPEFSDIMKDQLGVPIYPKAKPDDLLSNGKDDSGNEIKMASFTTTDSFDQVMAYYRKNLKGFKETEKKPVKDSVMGGFQRIDGRNTDFILIEKPAKGPIKIAITVSHPAKQ